MAWEDTEETEDLGCAVGECLQRPVPDRATRPEMLKSVLFKGVTSAIHTLSQQRCQFSFTKALENYFQDDFEAYKEI